VSTVLACGVAVLDVQQTIDRLPGPDEKMVADGLVVASGGPAANAAVTAAALGAGAQLLTRIGGSPLGTLISADLAEHGVDVVDRAGPQEQAVVSTVLVTRATGQRAVISVSPARRPPFPAARDPDGPAPAATRDPDGPTPASDRDPDGPAPATGRHPEPAQAAALVAGVDAVLVDGHHLDLALPVAAAARAAGIPVLLDGGSWKPGLEDLLALVDIAVISAALQVPATLRARDPHMRDDVLAQVSALGPAVVARSRGPLPIEVLTRSGRTQVPVPSVAVVDTLGAGDVLHGALLALLAARGSDDILGGLAWAARVAADSCTAPGARGWLADEERLRRHRRRLGA
jgi:sugar/nucleoside kinase (ribokinase family)